MSPERHRQALLALTDHLGYQLRTTGQATARLTITVRYADSSTTTRQQALAEPSNHTANLARTAYDLYGKLGLQRARVRSITVRCEQLMDAARATEQLSLDPHATSVLVAEGAIDALNRRFGPGTVRSAATYGPEPSDAPSLPACPAAASSSARLAVDAPRNPLLSPALRTGRIA
ncbi:hypothetical protein LUR56_41025 [Streptomyces sp. MT29]|nr:hypothetical protein [Streptomyces sp. MT29]